ncbi:MAG: alanine aminotransferase [Candidatus Micrarchaeota archaeon]|nr:MAG: alanine aminotransferase [Candidatus Micrarchaeota archaeon]
MLADRVKYVSVPLHEEDRLAERLIKEGKKVIKMNSGDPTKYFPLPDYIKEAYKRAIENNKNSYSNPVGIDELREAVANRYSKRYNIDIKKEDVFVTEGVSEALSFLNFSLIDSNSKAVLFKPYYPSYLPYLKVYGGDSIILDYKEESAWSIDIDQLEQTVKALKADGSIKKVRYMLITNPNNPTGTVLDRKTLDRIIDIANDNNILLISDEIYDEIVFNNASFTSISSLGKGVRRVILHGASKVYDATGLRLGFIIIPEDDEESKQLKEAIYELASLRLSSNTPAQYAIAEAISNEAEHNKHISYMVDSIKRRVDIILDNLPKEIFKSVRPNGAFYVFPRADLSRLDIKDDAEFVHKLLEEKYVQITRGSGFGAPGHVRFVALPDEDIIKDAIERIKEFCNAHSR